MATGYYTNGNCYPDQQQAVDTFFQYQQTKIEPQTDTIFVFLNRDNTGQWSYQKTTVTDTGAISHQFNLPLANPVFASCDTSDFSQYDITPANVLYVTSWGLGFILLMWSLGYAIGAATGSIKKV